MSPDDRSRLISVLRERHGLSPVIAVELEFTLHNASAHPEAFVLEGIRESAERAELPLYHAEKERARDQYETATMPDRDLDRLIRKLARFKVELDAWAGLNGMKADFAAKPFADEPGNGLHIHLHLENRAGNNVFSRQGESLSPALQYTMGGLLATMKSSLVVFSPHESSRARFSATPIMPTTVSWGFNNRSAAIRLPSKSLAGQHLEHRIAGADANIEAVIAVILQGVLHGLENQTDPGPPVYGDASDPQYGKETLL